MNNDTLFPIFLTTAAVCLIILGIGIGLNAGEDQLMRSIDNCAAGKTIECRQSMIDYNKKENIKSYLKKQYKYKTKKDLTY